MSGKLFSASWYRVARLRPQLRPHARFHRHLYRGEVWYVLEDRASGRCHRLAPAAYQVVALMDGQRTTQEIWEAAQAVLGDEGPSQDEAIRLLGLLHAADVLQCDVSPDTEELLRRCQRREQQEWWRRFANPLAVRIPLVDPDAFLERALPWVRPLFSRAGALVWGAFVAMAAVLAVVHWGDLTHGARDALLEPRNLLLLWLAYPVLKGLHELGHAFAVKVHGGEVHEMGILLLVLMPVPYVDASAASVLPDKGQRALVGAAGVLVELFLAALALLVWLMVEPGALRVLAYDVVWIGAASSLLFNGNPLLRYDGYYVLSDWIEIPNLAARSNQYWGWLVLRHGFGLSQVRYPVAAAGEERWFLGYGPASFVYRTAILLAIAFFLAGRFLGLGLLVAVAALVTQVGVPAVRHALFVLTSPRLGSQRSRAVALSMGAVLGVLGLGFGLPLPFSTRAQGVVWPSPGSEVRAGAEGFVARTLAPPGSTVQVGDALVLTEAPSLKAEVAVLDAEVRELRARHHAERHTELVKAQITLEELVTKEAELARGRERMGEGVVRSPADGVFVVPDAADLAGRFVRQGERIGWVVGQPIPTVRVVVSQADVAVVRDRVRGVEVRLARRPEQVLPAALGRQVPAATDALPSRALGHAGGGPFAVDPEDPDGLRTLEPVFQLEVELAAGAGAHGIGARAHVRFDHGAEPVAYRLARGVRRLFLRRIGV